MNVHMGDLSSKLSMAWPLKTKAPFLVVLPAKQQQGNKELNDWMILKFNA